LLRSCKLLADVRALPSLACLALPTLPHISAVRACVLVCLCAAELDIFVTDLCPHNDVRTLHLHLL
jgi:hypothetical protein